jgi:hypothetical protein
MMQELKCSQTYENPKMQLKYLAAGAGQMPLYSILINQASQPILVCGIMTRTCRQ